MRGSLFSSKYGHSRTYFIKVLTFEKVVLNWREFVRSHEIGSNKTKKNGRFSSVFARGSRKIIFSLCKATKY